VSQVQVQTDRTLVPRVGGSISTSRLLQIKITVVNPPSDGNCLFASCISKLEDLHAHNVMLVMTMTMRDGLKWISSLLCPFVIGQNYILFRMVQLDKIYYTCEC